VRVLFTYMLMFSMTYMLVNPLYFFSTANTMAELVEEEHHPKDSSKSIKVQPYIASEKSRCAAIYNLLQKNKFAQYQHFKCDEDHSQSVYLPPDAA
jgi:hypothetical protein